MSSFFKFLSSAQSERGMLHRLLEHLPNPVMLCDQDFLITYMNPASRKAMKRMLVVSENMPLDRFYAIPKRDRVAMQDRGAEPYEAQFTFGEEEVELVATALENERGDFEGIYIQWNTISEPTYGPDTTLSKQLLKTTLDCSESCMMIADAENNILYLNDNLRELFRSVEEDLKENLPDFDLESIVGTNIDVFHKNPKMQRTMLQRMTETFKSTIEVGNALFHLVANPIFDEKGNRTGTCVEWSKNIDSSKVEALDKSQAVVEYKMDGTILDANANFLRTSGYTMEEIKGQHHSLFVEAEHKNSAEYAELWAKFQRGEYCAGEYKRLGKGGKEIWIQASYNPIIGLKGKPVRVVEFAVDITEQKKRDADYAGQLAAIRKSQAIIEFNMDGSILTANDNFLATLGYTLDEIKGKHHSMFVDPEYRNSEDYAKFWEQLRRGEYCVDEFKRFGRGGKEVWIQASYNPILDMNGKPYKVVKYASDTTAVVKARMENERGAEEVKQVLNALSQGDLSHTMHNDYQGTFAEIKLATNTTMEKLNSIVANVKMIANVFLTAR